jgi:DNA processing protein
MMEKPAGQQLSDRQRLNWLRLIRTSNVGPATFRDLINRFGSAEKSLEMLPELVRSSGTQRKFRIPSLEETEKEIDFANRNGARFLCMGEPDYPAALKRIEYAPPILAVKGDTSALNRPAIAIVGARNASLAGIKMAQKLAQQLGQEGYAIVSGLARGIDTAAHKGSLKTGTIGVLAGGLDRPYPPENIPLCGEITANAGVVISEMPFGWEPRAQDFPRRNRVVAGIALGLVVIEAAQRSGSLISARLANEMGRTIFAVPGSPLDPRAAGTNRLLKEGATLVTEAQDVLDTLAPMLASPLHQRLSLEEPAHGIDAVPEIIDENPGSDDERSVVMEILGPTPTSIDEIIGHTGLHASRIMTVLLELDLSGRIERHSGGAVSLVGLDS